jgi:DNA-binding Xre family transcriptional regulator
MEETIIREPLTNLERILREKNLSQADLRRLIQRKSGFLIGRDRISKICTGRMIKYNIETAVMIAEALEINVGEIIELKNVKKVNSYDKSE